MVGAVNEERRIFNRDQMEKDQTDKPLEERLNELEDKLHALKREIGQIKSTKANMELIEDCSKTIIGILPML